MKKENARTAVLALGVVLAVFALPMNALATDVSGEISQDTTWTFVRIAWDSSAPHQAHHQRDGLIRSADRSGENQRYGGLLRSGSGIVFRRRVAAVDWALRDFGLYSRFYPWRVFGGYAVGCHRDPYKRQVSRGTCDCDTVLECL